MQKTRLTHKQTLIKTQRLRLRALQEKDADTLYQYRNQPEVSLFQGWTPENSEEVSDYAKQMQSRQPCAAGHWYQVVIELLENEINSSMDKRPIIGDVAFCIETEMEKQAELGIAIDKKYQGKGYAQEAIKGLVDFLFESFDLHRIHVSIDPANNASRKLFERVGFRFEGHLISAVYFKGKWCDDIIMGLLKSEWLS